MFCHRFFWASLGAHRISILSNKHPKLRDILGGIFRGRDSIQQFWYLTDRAGSSDHRVSVVPTHTCRTNKHQPHLCIPRGTSACTMRPSLWYRPDISPNTHPLRACTPLCNCSCWSFYQDTHNPQPQRRESLRIGQVTSPLWPWTCPGRKKAWRGRFLLAWRGRFLFLHSVEKKPWWERVGLAFGVGFGAVRSFVILFRCARKKFEIFSQDMI